MQILFHRDFEKSLRALPKVLREKVFRAIRLFRKNPFDPRLRNHALHGVLQGERAIWVTYACRIVFIEHGGYVQVLFLDVGNHDQVYR